MDRCKPILWAVVFLVVLGSSVEAQVPLGVTLDGKPVEGTTLRGAEVPFDEVVAAWLTQMADARVALPIFYQQELEKVGIDLGTEAEAAVRQASSELVVLRRIDHTLDTAPVLDLREPGAAEEMARRSRQNAEELGRVYGKLLRDLDEASYPSEKLDGYLQQVFRESVTVTYLEEEDPRLEVEENLSAFRRGREEKSP